MTEKTDQNFKFDATGILDYVLKHYKILLTLTIISGVIATIVSMFIANKYKSTVVLFPTSTISISQTLLTDNASTKGILNFGEDEESEQIIQVLQSDEIKQRIIQKYNLFEHYKIDKNSQYAMTILLSEIEENIMIKRTEYMSIVIDVLDTDPQTAANIANDISNLLDTAMNHIQNDRAKLALKVVEDEYNELRNSILQLEDSLDVLRSLGVYDYESQAEVFSDAYAQAVAKNNLTGAKQLEEKLGILARYGGAYVSIRDFLEHEKKQLSAIKAKYAEAKVDAEQNLPHKFIVNNATKAEKKAYPMRSMIIAFTMISTFILTLILLLLYDIIGKTLKKH